MVSNENEPRRAGWWSGSVGAGGSGGAEQVQDDTGRLVHLAETAEAIAELDPMVADDDLLEQLVAASGKVRAIVPDCIGLSLTLREEGVTFTLVASDTQVAALDAVQYLAGGPCVDALTTGTVIDLRTRRREEWTLFADASRRLGVASTLSLPLRDDGRGAAGINLYGASPGCFDGHHDELAEVFGSLADEAITDADLAFSTRTAARQAPHILRETAVVEVAEQLLARALDLDRPRARQRLIDAARRAGIGRGVVARTLIAALTDSDVDWTDPA